MPDSTESAAILEKVIRGFEILEERKENVDALSQVVQRLELTVNRLVNVMEQHPKGTIIERVLTLENAMDKVDKIEHWVTGLGISLIIVILGIIGDIIVRLVK